MSTQTLFVVNSSGLSSEMGSPYGPWVNVQIGAGVTLQVYHNFTANVTFSWTISSLNITLFKNLTDPSGHFPHAIVNVTANAVGYASGACNPKCGPFGMSTTLLAYQAMRGIPGNQTASKHLGHLGVIVKVLYVHFFPDRWFLVGDLNLFSWIDVHQNTANYYFGVGSKLGEYSSLKATLNWIRLS